MTTIKEDLRFAVRMLIRKPAFTSVAMLSLALGIGANTTIFTIVNEFFLHPLPVEAQERVVAVYTTDEKNPGSSALSHLNWRDVRDDNDVFTEVIGYEWSPMSVASGDGEPSYLFGQLVSGNYFDGLGVPAFRGRTFSEHEDATPGTHPVVVLSHRYWSRQMGRDDAVIGQAIKINSHPFQVIGVAPAEFTGTDVGVLPDLWVPMMMNPVIKPGESLNWYETRRGLFIFTLARLKPGVSLAEARANMNVLAERLEHDYPDDNKGRGLRVKPLAEATVNPGLRTGLMMGASLLAGIAGLVLLIACFNVANLFLARASERRCEIATRLALGAGRWRLIQQLLTESLLVWLLGGVLGLGMAYLAKSLLLSVLPSLSIPISLNLGLELDLRVLLFTLGLALFSGLLFGLVPAIQCTRPGLMTTIRDQTEQTFDAGRKFAVRDFLVVWQVALSVVALIVAGLFIRNLAATQQSDPGFKTDNLMALSFDVGLQGYGQPRGEQFFSDVAARTRALPGVRAATVAQAGPLQGSLMRSVILEGQEGDDNRTFVQVNVVESEYFETLGIPVLQGRRFEKNDRDGSQPVVMINETMAKKFWPGEDPLGRTFTFFGFDHDLTIVGVVKDIKYNSLGEDPQPYAYQPLAQQYMTGMTLIARTDSAPEQVLITAQREIREMDPDMPLIGVTTISETLDNALWAPRIGASMLSIFGFLALVLAVIGLYGVMSYAVQRRAREIGIRMALGADRLGVLGMVVRQGLIVVGLGLMIGLVLALVVSQLLQSLLLITPTDPVAFGGALLILVLASLGASFFPARRATGIDPINTLRYQ